MLLMLVARSPDNISQKELAEKLQITPAAVAMTLKKLENSGYISRHIDKIDNRVNRTVILPKGVGAVQLSEKCYVEVDNAMLEGISEAELDAFVRTMEKINNNLAALGLEDCSKLSEKE
jgi:DNA-binding MarR family transcriptional regulator